MRLAALALLLATLATPTPARAAESYDSCTGTIASIPVTLTTQGTWCLKADLATALASGDMITVAANNITIDCNGFKLGNLSAGEDTQTTGIRAVDRSNVTVRGCNLRGFRNAVDLTGFGHVIEDNRFEASRNSAVRVGGDAMAVRRNRIIDTGGQNYAPTAILFAGDTDVVDNVIDGVRPKAEPLSSVLVFGIYGSGTSTFTIRGNVIRGLDTLAHSGGGNAIYFFAGEGDVIDNKLQGAGAGAAASPAIFCDGGDGFVRDNRATGFNAVTSGCPAEVAGNQLRN